MLRLTILLGFLSDNLIRRESAFVSFRRSWGGVQELEFLVKDGREGKRICDSDRFSDIKLCL